MSWNDFFIFTVVPFVYNESVRIPTTYSPENNVDINLCKFIDMTCCSINVFEKPICMLVSERVFQNCYSGKDGPGCINFNCSQTGSEGQMVLTRTCASNCWATNDEQFLRSRVGLTTNYRNDFHLTSIVSCGMKPGYTVQQGEKIKGVITLMGGMQTTSSFNVSGSLVQMYILNNDSSEASGRYVSLSDNYCTENGLHIHVVNGHATYRNTIINGNVEDGSSYSIIFASDATLRFTESVFANNRGSAPLFSIGSDNSAITLLMCYVQTDMDTQQASILTPTDNNGMQIPLLHTALCNAENAYIAATICSKEVHIKVNGIVFFFGLCCF